MAVELLFSTLHPIFAATLTEFNADAGACIEAYKTQHLDPLATFYNAETWFDDPTSRVF